MAVFDPYHKWLGIPPAEQPVNHYRLLGVTLFESDPDVIDAATDQRVTYLRQCATGQHIAESQKLLNEVAAARLCLLNAERKREYDQRLRKSVAQTRSAVNPATSAATPLAMPWEGQADEVVEGHEVPDFNSTTTKSKPARKGSRNASSVVARSRMAVAALLLGAIAVGIAMTIGQRNGPNEPSVAQQASPLADQPNVAQKKKPSAKAASPTASIRDNRVTTEPKPTPDAGGKSSPRTHAYAEPFNEKQTLDVYARSDGKTRPIVFWIHGGGWQGGDKTEVELKPQAFLEKGFVFVSTNYRLLPNVTVKQIAGDVAKAIRWTHDHATEFGGDPKTIFVMGHSAGAQMASLICTDDRYLKAEGLSLSNIKGCVPVDGDTYDVQMQIAAVEQRIAEIYMRKFGIIALQKELSPVTHVAKGKSIPPILLLYVADHPETKPQAQRFATLLSEAGVSAKAYPAENKTHATINSDLGLPGDKPTDEVFAFLDRQLSGAVLENVSQDASAKPTKASTNAADIRSTETPKVSTPTANTPRVETPATLKPQVSQSPVWKSLADNLGEFDQHWKKGDSRGSLRYDAKTKTLVIDSPHDLGTITYLKNWSAFSFDVRVRQLSFGNFDLEINGNTLKLGNSVLKPNQWVEVRVVHAPSNRSLDALVNGKAVTSATVAKGFLTTALTCKINSGGGQGAILEIKNIRVLTGSASPAELTSSTSKTKPAGASNSGAGKQVATGAAAQWKTLANDFDELDQHWRKGTNSGNFRYDAQAKVLSINSPHDLGTISYKGKWSELSFEVRASQLSFDNFDLAVNENTLKLGRSILRPGTWVTVRITCQASARQLDATVDGRVVSSATVPQSLTNQLECRLNSGGGQNAVLELKNIRVRTGSQ